MTGSRNQTLLAICTRNRPDQLRQLLSTLRDVRVTPPLSFRVVVADNSDGAEARSVVTELNGGDAWIGYVAVAERGVARVRNAAIDQRERGEHLLFIDDDEWPAEGFFAALVRGLEQFPDCLLGFEQTGVIGSDFYPTFGPSVRDGDELEACGFGNILLPSALLDSHQLRCNERYARSGGEDTDFCFAARSLGFVTRALPSAVCFETRSPVRTTVGYRWARSFAEGAIYSDVLRRHHRSRLASRAPRLVARTLVGVAQCFVDVPRGRGIGRGVESCALGLGGFVGLVGVLPTRY